MSKLEEPMKAAFYGDIGTGKTTLASTFPKPLLIIDCKEKGTDSISDVKGVDVFRPECWDDVEEIFWHVKHSAKYKTVVIDTLGGLQYLATEQVMQDTNKKGEVGHWGTMTQSMWLKVSTKMKNIILDIRDLDVNAVFTAHEKVFKVDEDEELEEDAPKIAPKVGPATMPSVKNTVLAAVNIIGCTYISEKYVKLKPKKKGLRPREKRVVDYCLKIGPHGSYITKVRKPKVKVLPAVLVDPSYEDLLKLTKPSKEKGVKKNGKTKKRKK